MDRGAGLETRGQSELRDWERHALKAEVPTSTGSLEKECREGRRDERGMTQCAEVPPDSYSGRVIRVGEWVGKRERNKVVVRDMEQCHRELRSRTAPGEHKV